MVKELEAAHINVDRFTPKTLDRTKFSEKTFIPKDLKTCETVFIRDDTIVKGPLAPRYRGPYKVIAKDWAKNTFTLFVRGKEDKYSISRLKPANQCKFYFLYFFI